VNVWIAASIGLAAAFVPVAIVLFRGTLMSRIAAVQLLSVFTTLALLTIPMGIHRPDLLGTALASAIVTVSGTLLFAILSVRWLR